MKVRGMFGSIAASGKFADMLVAFPWKGLQCVRKLVYPAQPNTPPQVAQKGHMADAMAQWHTTPWTLDDNAAWAKLASLRPKGETGPNQFTREYIRVVRIPSAWSELYAGADAAAGGFDRELIIVGAAGLVNVRVQFGTNKHFLNYDFACVWDAVNLWWDYDIVLGTFVSGERVYFQFYDGANPAASIGITGIYYFDMP
jgi:hypothetical protein